MPRLLLAALTALVGCSGGGDSCDDLAGVWTDGDGRQYHLVANKSGYEGYVLWNSARPPDGGDDGVIWAPLVIDLRAKSGGELVGLQRQRAMRADKECVVERRLTGRCDAGELTLELARAGTIDWTTCETAAVDGADAVQLRR